MNDNEQTVWKSPAQLLASTGKRVLLFFAGFLGFIVVTGISVATLNIGIKYFDFTEAIIIAIIALVIFLVGIGLVLNYLSKNKWAKISYELTNQRALVFSKNKLVNQCNLADCTVTTHDVRSLHRNGSSVQVGDVFFMKKGVVALKFLEVLDPYSVSNIANQVVSALQPISVPITSANYVSLTNAPKLRYCPNCGTQLKDGSVRFCGNCGNQLN
jgi:hypothetical protein